MEHAAPVGSARSTCPRLRRSWPGAGAPSPRLGVAADEDHRCVVVARPRVAGVESGRSVRRAATGDGQHGDGDLRGQEEKREAKRLRVHARVVYGASRARAMKVHVTRDVLRTRRAARPQLVQTMRERGGEGRGRRGETRLVERQANT